METFEHKGLILLSLNREDFFSGSYRQVAMKVNNIPVLARFYLEDYIVVDIKNAEGLIFVQSKFPLKLNILGKKKHETAKAELIAVCFELEQKKDPKGQSYFLIKPVDEYEKWFPKSLIEVEESQWLK
ncbi:MAG: hypothetical protein QXE51_03245 [Nitrososphaeria archaeon]